MHNYKFLGLRIYISLGAVTLSSSPGSLVATLLPEGACDLAYQIGGNIDWIPTAPRIAFDLLYPSGCSDGRRNYFRQVTLPDRSGGREAGVTRPVR